MLSIEKSLAPCESNHHGRHTSKREHTAASEKPAPHSGSSVHEYAFPTLSKDIMGQIPDLTFCVSVHPTVLKAIMCILCVAVGTGSHLATGPFHTPTVLSFIPRPLSRARSAGLHCCLAASEMALGGGEPGRKQVETVPVTAISVPLGQAQLWMKEWGSGGTEEKAGWKAGSRSGWTHCKWHRQLSTETS